MLCAARLSIRLSELTQASAVPVDRCGWSLSRFLRQGRFAPIRLPPVSNRKRRKDSPPWRECFGPLAEEGAPDWRDGVHRGKSLPRTRSGVPKAHGSKSWVRFTKGRYGGGAAREKRRRLQLTAAGLHTGIQTVPCSGPARRCSDVHATLSEVDFAFSEVHFTFSEVHCTFFRSALHFFGGTLRFFGRALHFFGRARHYRNRRICPVTHAGRTIHSTG